MRRIVLLTIAALLMSGTAVFGASERSGGQDKVPCGQPSQPPCEQRGQPPAGERDRAPRGQNGQSPDRQSPGQAPDARQRPPAAQEQRPSAAQQRQFDASRLPPPAVRRPGFADDQHRWSRGDRLPPQYRQDQYTIQDWRTYNLRQPPSGHLWYCQRGGNCFLVAVATGIIRETYRQDDRENYWRHRYVRVYAYSDDFFYNECRHHPDPAGIIVGGLIGGLLGSTLSGEDRAGAVFAGVIIGGALGAVLTSGMDCEDRSYAYRAYYDGLNSGLPGIYPWDNPRNHHRGEFQVRSYYYDPDGFYCANYTQSVWLDGHRLSNGRTCRQPDGAWAFLD